MTDRDNIIALLAIARAKGLDLDPEATHLTLAQLAALAGEAEITIRRAIWADRIKAEQVSTAHGWQHRIPVVDAAAYLVGKREKKEEGGE